MSLSRRAFVQTLGIGAAGAISSNMFRGGEPLAGLWSEARLLAADSRALLLHNNENPVGPGQHVLDAIRAAFGEGGKVPGRYPFDTVRELHKAIADRYSISPKNVLAGAGSTQPLRSATQVFTSKTRPLVGGAPTYEECAGYSELIGNPVKAVPLDSQMRLDLNAMAEAAKGAGLVFLNNPNNPTATVLPAAAIEEFVTRVLKSSPDTTILIDEAYHDYVTDPSHKTQIRLALKNPRVLVARTYSKAHGMAGLRVGYLVGMEDTLKTVSDWDGTGSVSVLAIAGAVASIKNTSYIDSERARNTEVRRYTMDWFKKAGFEPTDSQGNFIFVNIKQPAKEFRDACRAQGVLVGRDFPPYEKSHARISLGTLDEMKRATDVFAKVLGMAAKAAA